MHRTTLLSIFFLVASSQSGCTIITDNATEDPIRCDAAADGTYCGNEFSDGIDRICVASSCVASGCGDGFFDPQAGEECDDGNDVDGDGCESTCVYSCKLDSECDDEQLCSGAETCDQSTHRCVAGTAVVCTPSDACHSSECREETDGTCVETLIDADGDGYAASTLGACGTDCDDADPNRSPGHVDICGDGIDNDCNSGTLDNTATTWFIDCDGDGYSPTIAGALTDCNKPTAAQTGCPAGSAREWTSRNPGVQGQADCADSAALAYPGAPAFHTDTVPVVGGYNWNCQNGTELQFGSGSLTCKPKKGCLNIRGECCYFSTSYSGWTDGTAPYCNVTESMRICGSTLSPNPCGDTVSVTQGCR